MQTWSTTAAISDLQTGGWIGGEIAAKELVHNFVNFQNCGLLWTYCETARLMSGRGHGRHLCRRIYSKDGGRVQ
jgi:hypothetical protein